MASATGVAEVLRGPRKVGRYALLIVVRSSCSSRSTRC